MKSVFYFLVRGANPAAGWRRGQRRTIRQRRAKKEPPGFGGSLENAYLRLSLMAACAAARRAMGTRNGEQDT